MDEMRNPFSVASIRAEKAAGNPNKYWGVFANKVNLIRELSCLMNKLYYKKPSKKEYDGTINRIQEILKQGYPSEEELNWIRGEVRLETFKLIFEKLFPPKPKPYIKNDAWL